MSAFKIPVENPEGGDLLSDLGIDEIKGKGKVVPVLN
jgi:hypothetical protein